MNGDWKIPSCYKALPIASNGRFLGDAALKTKGIGVGTGVHESTTTAPPALPLSLPLQLGAVLGSKQFINSNCKSLL